MSNKVESTVASFCDEKEKNIFIFKNFADVVLALLTTLLTQSSADMKNECNGSCV